MDKRGRARKQAVRVEAKQKVTCNLTVHWKKENYKAIPELFTEYRPNGNKHKFYWGAGRKKRRRSSHDNL